MAPHGHDPCGQASAASPVAMVVEAHLSGEHVVRAPGARDGGAHLRLRLGAVFALTALTLLQGARRRGRVVGTGFAAIRPPAASTARPRRPLQGVGLGEKLLDGVNKVAYPTRAVTSLVLHCSALVLQCVVAFAAHRRLALKLLEQVRRDAVVVSTTFSTSLNAPCVRHHSAALLLQFMVRVVMSAREGAAGQVRVHAALGLEGVTLGGAGPVRRMRFPGVEEVGPTVRVSQGHGVIRGVAGHRVVETTAAGQAFHRHRGRVDMRIQAAQAPEPALKRKKHRGVRKPTNRQEEREIENRIINISYLHILKARNLLLI